MGHVGRMKNNRYWWSLVALCLFLVAADSVFGAANPLKGRWKVTTRLVAAQDPINQGYDVGDRRVERWKIRGNKRKAVLKTPSGKIRGKRKGKAWEFDQNYVTGLGAILRMYIVARQRGQNKMRGTIKARYFSQQFGYLIGIDAWSFKGRRV